MSYQTCVVFSSGRELELELDDESHENLQQLLVGGVARGWVSLWSEEQQAGYFLPLAQVLFVRWS